MNKYLFSLVCATLIGMTGYLLWSNTSPTSTHEPVHVSPTLTESTQSKTGIETDTGKRLETYAHANTGWGMSPFGSGKPLTEAEKPIFHKPNTEWKTRTLSGITYVFGKGNPMEVALSEDELQNFRKRCGTTSDPENTGYLCKEEDGYVTPEVEQYIKSALSDSNWETLLTQCEENLRYSEGVNISLVYKPQAPLTYPIVTYSDFLDINSWIGIDTFGRKTLDFGRVFALQEWLSSGFEAFWKEREWPTHQDGSKWIFKHPQCVDIYGVNILRNLVLARMSYLGAGQDSWVSISQYGTPEAFIQNFFR